MFGTRKSIIEFREDFSSGREKISQRCPIPSIGLSRMPRGRLQSEVNLEIVAIKVTKNFKNRKNLVKIRVKIVRTALKIFNV